MPKLATKIMTMVIVGDDSSLKKKDDSSLYSLHGNEMMLWLSYLTPIAMHGHTPNECIR